MEIQNFGKLIRTITSNINYYIGSKIDKYGIKQGQFEYFLLIYSSPGINQLELARLKNVGKASVTKALIILEGDGFIRRVSDEKDKRNTLCYVTEKGEMIVDDLIHVKTNAEKELFKGFKGEDKQVFYEYLSLLHLNSEALVANIDSKIEED
ncbi:MarR family transcriptional regulator [Clostridium sp. D2Q-11]|uniref:MarR family transcriptional regulator n=1 Tax=Anaeromonas frigoriresistens TaxID=2683708 RepID=A0A942Z7X4_9FIRM|nr:MarR family transcriptional regulator [Anaeromonas frigoriresistens]MBS4537380.1 MarR family transcriptional regulator [Anaeromonas frigoriresistens]